MTVKNVKKISVSVVFGQIDTPAGITKLAAEGRIHVMSVMGQAISTKAGNKVWPDGTTRPWEALQGVFKAINPDTKEEFRGATLFLPDVVLVPIKVAMVDPEHGNMRAATFAVNLFAVLAANRKAGGSLYEYEFESLLPLDENDPIAQIERQLAQPVPPALPAPSTDQIGTAIEAASIAVKAVRKGRKA